MILAAAELAALYGWVDVVETLTKGDSSETAESLRRVAHERRHSHTVR
jgi:hypothetical protein